MYYRRKRNYRDMGKFVTVLNQRDGSPLVSHDSFFSPFFFSCRRISPAGQLKKWRLCRATSRYEENGMWFWEFSGFSHCVRV